MIADFVQGLVHEGVLVSPFVRDAFMHIDRADFVLPEYRNEAYGDYPLPIGYGQTISQPYTVAYMLDLLNPHPGEKVLDIGSGSGWTTALLAYIVSQPAHNQRPKDKNQRGAVFSIEIIPELCEWGKTNCEKYRFVSSGVATFFCHNGNAGLPVYAPFDKILCSASLRASDVSQAWKTQLRTGGKIVTPILDSVWMFDKIDTHQWKQTEHPGFAFVPLVTQRVDT